MNGQVAYPAPRPLTTCAGLEQCVCVRAPVLSNPRERAFALPSPIGQRLGEIGAPDARYSVFLWSEHILRVVNGATFVTHRKNSPNHLKSRGRRIVGILLPPMQTVPPLVHLEGPFQFLASGALTQLQVLTRPPKEDLGQTVCPIFFPMQCELGSGLRHF